MLTQCICRVSLCVFLLYAGHSVPSFALFLFFLHFPDLPQSNPLAFPPSSPDSSHLLSHFKYSCLYSAKGVFPLTKSFLLPSTLTASQPPAFHLTGRPLTQHLSCVRRRSARAYGRVFVSKSRSVAALSQESKHPRPLNALAPSLSAFPALCSHKASISPSAP